VLYTNSRFKHCAFVRLPDSSQNNQIGTHLEKMIASVKNVAFTGCNLSQSRDLPAQKF